ncbi:hypothetical protein ACFU99_35960, partial [Streptomyces sp. NPDC057654]
LTRARQELDRLETTRQELLNEHEEVTGQTRDARQRAEGARQEITGARQRVAAILDAAREEAGRTRNETDAALKEAREAADEQRSLLDDLIDRAEQQRGQVRQCEEALGQVTAQVREAALIRDRLSGDLAALDPQAPDAALSGDGPLYRSEAKEEGWRHYLHTLAASGGEQEPAAADLAARFGVDVGNARNWLRDFRAARAAQLAARTPRADLTEIFPALEGAAP